MKKGTKRIKTWIKYFPKDIQEKIISNVEEQRKYENLEVIVHSQSSALINLFTWGETPELKGEGFDYWNDIYDDLKAKGK